MDFMVKIIIYSYDKIGQKYRFLLHTEEDPSNEDNQFLDYQDYVEKGQILGDKLPKILKDDFGIKKIYSSEFLEIPNNENEDEDLDPFRYELWVETDYDPSCAGSIGDIYANWFEENE